MKIRRTFGFTLAEVLITLGIIGVVAAMIMPTLIQNQQKRSLEVATQKFYSMMSQAVKQYMADFGVDDLRNSPLARVTSYNYNDYESEEHRFQKACEDFVQKYLKVVKVCEDGCFADTYTTQKGEVSDAIGSGSERSTYIGKFVLTDGAVLDVGNQTEDWPIELFVDINGKKGPNKIGYDFWSMTIFYDGSIDEGNVTPECKRNNECPYTNSPSEVRAWRFDDCQDGNAYGGCFGHFLENGFKFDY